MSLGWILGETAAAPQNPRVLAPPLSLFSLVVMNSLREREEREKIICVRTVQSVEPEHGRKEGGFSQKKLVAVRKLDI
jgi:hypothetical protein